MVIELTRRRATAVLIVGVVGLTVASFAARVLRYRFGDDGHWRLLRILDAGAEDSIPTWWSAATLLACALLLAVIARAEWTRGGRYARHWATLAVLLLAASVDEVARIHEAIGSLVWWVGPGAVIVAGVAIAYARFVRSLSAPVRRRVMVAATVFAAGAIGLEVASAAVIAESDVPDWDDARGTAKVVVGLLTSFEELSEMLGAVVMLDALMLHVATASGDVRIRLRGDESGAGRPRQDGVTLRRPTGTSARRSVRRRG